MIILSYIQVLECTGENTHQRTRMIILSYIQVLECTGENTLSEDENDNIGSFGIPELSVQLTEAGFVFRIYNTGSLYDLMLGIIIHNRFLNHL